MIIVVKTNEGIPTGEQIEDGITELVINGEMLTGVKDINGNDIYSGDTIALKFKGLQDIKSPVMFQEGEFGIQWECGDGESSWISLRAISNLKIERI